jgi:hypothetical protein
MHVLAWYDGEFHSRVKGISELQSGNDHFIEHLFYYIGPCRIEVHAVSIKVSAEEVGGSVE